MTAKVRKLVRGEERAFVESVHTPFLDPPTEDPDSEWNLDHWASRTDVERSWVAEARGRFVANCATHTMDLTVPGGPGQPCPIIPMGGLTAVGVHPTHRRQGLLSQMMSIMLEDCRRRGEPVAGLIASESVIYGRFGFGHATNRVKLRIDSGRSQFVRPAAAVDLELVNRDAASKVMAAIFESQRTTRPGEPNRSSGAWDLITADRAEQRGGGRGLFVAVCDGGFVRYRARDYEILHGERSEILVEELRGMTPEIEAALWRFVFDLDLIGPVIAKCRPVDEPLRWRLADPRQLQATRVDDFLWLRILDVPAALEGRGYRRSARLVLDLLPPLAGDSPADPAVGRWVLDASPEGASCRPALPGESADLRMEITDLGSLYLGGFSASLLAAGGRVQELTAGSLDVADALFANPLAPFTSTGF
jgi:predicted acetyltransferase